MLSVSSPSRTITIFLSYAITSSKDKKLFDELTTHLSILQSHYPTYEWYDSELSAGSPITQFIEDHLNRADLIVLLVSADFFACSELEMKLALARIATGAARLIPVLLRPSDWNATPLTHYAPLPSDGKPISLWSDRDAACTNVVQGIRQALDDLASQETIPTNSTPQRFPVCDPPYTYDDLFTDRETILAGISAFFTSTRPRRTSVLALSGIGGIGKTAIALEYCYLASQTCRDILWFNASSRTVLSTYVRTLAGQLSLPDSIRQDEQQLFATIKQWLHDQPDWLLVLDQIEDMTLLDLIVPPLSSGRVLLTTRARNTRNHIAILPVSSMDIDSSALFLLRRMHVLPPQALLDQAPPEAVHGAIAIAQEMDGVPLALEQTGAYLEKLDDDFSISLALYKKQRTQGLNEHEPTGDTHHRAETHVFTFEQLKDTPDLNLLHLLAFLYPDAIPEGLLVNGAQALDEPLQSLAVHALTLHQALAELCHASLIRYHADRSVLQIQRVVQEMVIESLTIEQQHYWAEQAVHLVNHAFPEVRFDTQALCERYLPQAQHCAILITRFHLTLKEGALLLERLGSFCLLHASYDEAEVYLTQALHLYEHHLQADILDTAQTLNSLGRLHRRRAHYTQAEVSHQRALQLREQALGFDHPKTAESLHNLALIHGDLGKYQEAESLYQRVLSIEERLKGSRHPDVADTLNNLGLTYAQQGRYTEAEQAYRRTLAIYRASRGAKHPDVAYPLNGLGALAEKRGNYRQAEKLYQQALAIRKQAFGEMHPEVARSINKLAGIAVSQGDYAHADILYQQALTMSEQMLGPRHPDVALILNDQALLATKQEHYLKARPLYQRALSVYTLVFGTRHPATATVLNNQGQLFRMLGNKERSEKLLRRSLAIREKVLDRSHPSIAQSLSNLADLLADQHKDEEAELLFQQAFALYLLIPAPRHPDIARIPEQYAFLLEHMGRSEEARALRKTAETQKEQSSTEPSQG